MGDPFLYLDMDVGGIHAMVVESTFSNKTILGQYHLMYGDLPELESGETLFQSGMKVIAAELDLDACSVAMIFISPLNVCFRNISLPFTQEKKIRQILPLELSPHLPLPEEPYVSDFFTQEVEFHEGRQLILSASILESDIEQLVSGLTPLKIRPLVITPNGYAHAVSFLKQRKLKQRKEAMNFVLIHHGTQVISLTLVVNQKPVTVRSFASMDPTAQELGLATLQTILGFRQRSGSDTLFDIFISTKTPSKYPPETLTTLSQILSRPSDPRPLIIETVDSNKLLSFISPKSRPEGLFNFCRGQFGSDTIFQKYKTRFISTIILIIFLFGTSIFNIRQDIAFLEQGIAMEKQIAQSIFNKTFPGKGNDHIQAPLLLMKSYVNQAVKKRGPHGQNEEWKNTPDIRATDVLFELSNKISDTIDVDLSRLILNNGRLIISGSTDNFNNVDKIKGLIEKSTLFKRVDISSAEAGKTKNSVLFKFIIEM